MKKQNRKSGEAQFISTSVTLHPLPSRAVLIRRSFVATPPVSILEELIRMASILEPSRASPFPAMTKIVGTLSPKSHSVAVISSCLKADMSVARFDFLIGDIEYHQETLENLRSEIKEMKKLCAVVNKSEHANSLQENTTVVLTPDQGKEASSELLPNNFGGFTKRDPVTGEEPDRVEFCRNMLWNEGLDSSRS